MEHVVAMAEGDWNSFNGMYSSSSTKEADFMAQLLGNCSLPNELNNNGSSIAWPVPLSNVNMVSAMDEASMYVTSDDNATDMYYFSSSTHEGSYYPNESHERVFVTNNPSMSMDYFMVDAKNINVNLIEGDDFLNQDVSNDSMESNENVPESADVLGREHMHEMNVPESSDIAKKRSRLPVDVQKNKRSVKLKKKQRVGSSSAGNDDDHEENNIAILQRQNSMMSCCSEDDDSNASQELNGRATSSSSSKGPGNGKTRANRGSATDPQSLYARKRRERINERLRILQSLVPNGTKVDISTMLEEAVQYVKFLQLQIKLLSSDDLWMYAPIAYNGMDIGLDLKIATTKS